jgi:hypothetical protein
VYWILFDHFIIFLIVLNSLFLGIMDYTDTENRTVQKQIVEKSELFFIIAFTIEFIIQVIATGFIIGKNTYLRDAWNWLDFIVVITSLLSLHPVLGNVSALRTFRLFRPLRSISSLPSMKLLVGTLLSSIS